MKTFAECTADFPDDTAHAAGGTVEIPGGKAIANVLVAGLESAGYAVDGPEEHENYGWVFYVDLGRVSIWCLLQYPEPWLLIATQNRTFWAWLRRRSFDQEHAEVIRALTRVIESDSRFSELKWSTREEYERSGA